MLVRANTKSGWAIAVGETQPSCVLCRDCGKYHAASPSPCHVIRATMRDAAADLLGTWPKGRIDRDTKTGRLRFTRHRHDHATAGNAEAVAKVLLLLWRKGVL